MVVNMLVVAEIFYLFNVRYLHMRSLTWRGAVGTPAVLGAIAVVAIAQLVYTYAPFMQTIFESRALTLGDGALIFALVATLFPRSEEHTSELQSLMRISYAVFCLHIKTSTNYDTST